MTRGAIYAGKAAILLTVQDQIDRGLVGIRNKLRMFSNSLGDLGAGALRGGILGSIGSGFMLKRFSEFSDELLNLQVKLGYFGNMTHEQSANMYILTTRIRELGKSTSFTSKEVAEAATQLAQAGFNIKEIRDSLQPVLDLARGTGFGLAESAAMMANAIRTFNLDTKQANTVVSQFVKATRLGTIEIQDLQEALKYASGSAVNLEQTLPTLLGLFVQMSEAGLKGSLAGTSLNTAMLNLVKNFKSMEHTLDGFELVKNQQGMLDLVATLEKLYQSTSKMSKLERVAIFQDIFNIRGARAISSTQEIERVIKFAREIKNAGNEARLASMKMDSGLGGAARRATSALDDLGKTIGFIVNVPLQGLLEAVPVVAGQLDVLARKFPQITLALVAMPFALVGVGVGLLGLSFTMRKVAGVVDLLLGGFRRLSNLASKGTMKQLGFFKGATSFLGGGKNATSLSQLKTIGSGVIGLGQKAGRGVAGAASQAKNLVALRAQNNLLISQAKGFERLGNAVERKYTTKIRGAIDQVADLDLEISNLSSAPITKMSVNTSHLDKKLFSSNNRLDKINKELRLLKDIPIEDTLFNPKKLAEAEGFLEEASKQLARVNSEIRLQENAYDRLYRVRKEIAALESGPLSSGGKGLLQKLRGKEATLAGIINKGDFSAQQAFFQKQVAQGRTNVAALSAQKTKAEAAKATIQRREALARARAVELAEQKKLTAAKIALAKDADSKVLNQMVERQNKIDALQKKRGIAQNSLDDLVKLKGAKVGAAKANASALRGMVSGFKGFSSARVLGSLGSIGKGLFSLAKGFFIAARGVARFVFSFSGVWTIFELLLLFGNKIPFIAQGLERLGKGFTLAFGEIGKIAKLAGPSLSMIGFGLKALTEGDGGNAALGFQAITTGIRGLIDIVGNQLAAAWQRVVIAVAPLYDVIRKIVSSLYEVVSLTLQMAFNFVGGRFAGIAEMLSGLGAGAADWNGIIKKFLQGMGWVIGSAFGILDRLAHIFDTFLFEFQMMMVNILQKAWMLNARDAEDLRNQARTIKGAQDSAWETRKNERQQMFNEFWDNIERIFTQKTEPGARAALGNAQGAAANTAAQTQAILEEMRRAHQQFMEARAAEIARLEAEGKGGLGGVSGGPVNLANEGIKIARIIDSLVGSAYDTRQNLLKKATYEEQSLDEQKRTRIAAENTQAELEEINKRGGTLVFQR